MRTKRKRFSAYVAKGLNIGWLRGFAAVKIESSNIHRMFPEQVSFIVHNFKA